MNYLKRYRLNLESFDGRVIFELTGSFDDLVNKYVNAEDWLCADFSDSFKKRFDENTGMVDYYTNFQCNDHPTLRLVGKKEYKAKNGDITYYDYQVGAKMLHFDYEVK